MHRINERIDGEFQAMQDRMLLVSEDVGGVLDAEKYVQTSANDRASLEQALAVNEGRLDFLYQVRNPQTVVMRGWHISHLGHRSLRRS